MSIQLEPFPPAYSIALALSLAASACGGSEEGAGSNTTPATGGETPAATTTVETPAMTAATPPAAVPDALPSAPPAGDETGFLDDPNAEPMVDLVDLSEENACAGLELVPEQVEVEVPTEITTTMEVLQPVAFYVVLDNSSSMTDALPVGAAQADGATTRWELAVSSLQAFVTSPSSEGLDVAIQYFNPPGQQGNFNPMGMEEVESDPLCNGEFHGTPDVAMGRLPENAQALSDSLTTAEPATGTPTLGALTGGIEYCKAFETANPDEDCVVVLVTDGMPSSCGLGGGGGMGGGMAAAAVAATDTLVPIAEAGLAAGVEVFTVGMDGVPPEGFTLLDAIAAAGGSDCTPGDVGGESCNVSSTGSQGLIETLNSIRDTVTVTETVTEVMTVIETQKLDCQWLIPEPPEEEGMLNPDRVNVTLSLDGAEPDFIPGVASEAACVEAGGLGWYYDDPAAPTTIHACPESCSQIQNGTNPAVQVLLGCARVVVEVSR